MQAEVGSLLEGLCSLSDRRMANSHGGHFVAGGIPGAVEETVRDLQDQMEETFTPGRVFFFVAMRWLEQPGQDLKSHGLRVAELAARSR